MRSNLAVKSNLVLDHPDYRPVHRFLPGDFVKSVYPAKIDRRVIESELTQRQIFEYEQYLVCLVCGMPCAGSCELSDCSDSD